MFITMMMVCCKNVPRSVLDLEILGEDKYYYNYSFDNNKLLPDVLSVVQRRRLIIRPITIGKLVLRSKCSENNKQKRKNQQNHFMKI